MGTLDTVHVEIDGKRELRQVIHYEMVEFRGLMIRQPVPYTNPGEQIYRTIDGRILLVRVNQS